MSKKLTLNDMKNIETPEEHSPTIVPFYNESGELVEIEFDTNLSLVEISTFVDTVADRVFTYLDEYAPEYRDVYTFVALINISNMPIPKKKVKDSSDVIDVKLAHEWMQKLGIVERLRDQDPKLGDLLALFNKLDSMITDKIEFKKQEILAFPKADFQNVCYTVQNFIGMISEFGEKFSGIDLNEVVANTKKIASMDETKITNAVLDFNTGKEVVAEDINEDSKTEE